jgi:SAM-dependent methyltransferase
MLPKNNRIQQQLCDDYEQVWHQFLSKSDFADDISRHRTNRERYHKALTKYLHHLRRPHVLEIGCGTAIDLNIIAAEQRDACYVGGDISRKSILLSLRVSALLENRIHFLVADARALPFQNDCFDLVFSQGLVEHFKNPEEIVKEQVRILGRGGILIINVPQTYTGYTLMKRKLMREGRWELGWETSFSYRDLRTMGNILGLIEREVFGYQYWRSWAEPTFVLRDLCGKLDRRFPSKDLRVFAFLKRAYDNFWVLLEKHWGHYFLQNIVILFQKKQ